MLSPFIRNPLRARVPASAATSYETQAFFPSRSRRLVRFFTSRRNNRRNFFFSPPGHCSSPHIRHAYTSASSHKPEEPPDQEFSFSFEEPTTRRPPAAPPSPLRLVLPAPRRTMSHPTTLLRCPPPHFVLLPGPRALRTPRQHRLQHFPAGQHRSLLLTSGWPRSPRCLRRPF